MAQQGFRDRNKPPAHETLHDAHPSADGDNRLSGHTSTTHLISIKLHLGLKARFFLSHLAAVEEDLA